MKILLTNHALDRCYGTENWTLEMARELAVRKHDVHVYSPHPGKMALRIARFCNVLADFSGHRFDLALVNHYWEMPHPQADRIIYTVHGTQNGLEEPPPDGTVVAVSEEAARGRYPVIRNGINCEAFWPWSSINQKPEQVFYLSHPDYASPSAIKIISDACRIAGIERFEWLVDEAEYVMPFILAADIVVGYGRGLMEAMACGRNVVSADCRTNYMDGFRGGGLVTNENFHVLKQDNFTGRVSGQRQFDVESLAREFAFYDPHLGQWLRERMVAEFNVKNTVEQYLKMV